MGLFRTDGRATRADIDQDGTGKRESGRPKKLTNEPEKTGAPPQLIYETDLGKMYCGDTLALLAGGEGAALRGKAQLVFTSPPFPLNDKKKYGNLLGEEYIEWFAGFAPKLKDLLTADGSMVVEIGNAWEPGRPVMSTVVLKALLRFLEAADLRTRTSRRARYCTRTDTTSI